MENSHFKEQVKTKEELRRIVGPPNKLAHQKIIPYLDRHCREFIKHSPFVIIATANHKGICDSSPRGDHAGFVQVVDEKRLLIPERRGNQKVDSMENILPNPQIGLLFLIPGIEETLRINGRACIVKEKAILETMAVNNKAPLLAIGVEVQECFLHCSKAFKRSKLWDPESWERVETLPPAAKIVAEHAGIATMEISNESKEGKTEHFYEKKPL
ncbi:MSMEG_1061 family FMN-dependent PPOX-type flavoprotein [Priestia megaterium]|jgi:PPOX class probable FMN-dependent enzyme|uniref:MSMEG_1061 family FMN-dependent PPOX-type flavoprotein n=1 Tax=Priestia megaterium TaxID=1404 RepID=UPI00286663D8|nr:MSMEG_1061 family FMN-dependent PPOX-type flavoprotein [Priestia megaterium]MDR7243033.1 PPOX class probable FMN-dependent enzyme [Priestia megaterium]